MKAIVLISGGLDSILAARMIKEQGVSIVPVNFKIPFCHINAHSCHGKCLADFVKISLDQVLRVEDISNDFLGLLLKPVYGFGRHMNPCIDCKILMLIKAKELMPELKAQFIVTGEVLGQRPMSQHKRALNTIEEKSGLKGFLLRPLCAKNLTVTTVEGKGWVDRDKLLGISGRSRRAQIKLAQEFGITGYPNASGGCLLTDRQFSARLKDLIRHKEIDLRNIELLKSGRHFRIDLHAKLIVGRNEKENKCLEEKAMAGDFLFMPEEKVAGPTCLGVGTFSHAQIALSAQIASRYCDLRQGIIKITYRRLPDNNRLYLNASSPGKDTLENLLI